MNSHSVLQKDWIKLSKTVTIAEFKLAFVSPRHLKFFKFCFHFVMAKIFFEGIPSFWMLLNSFDSIISIKSTNFSSLRYNISLCAIVVLRWKIKRTTNNVFSWACRDRIIFFILALSFLYFQQTNCRLVSMFQVF